MAEGTKARMEDYQLKEATKNECPQRRVMAVALDGHSFAGIFNVYRRRKSVPIKDAEMQCLRATPGFLPRLKRRKRDNLALRHSFIASVNRNQQGDSTNGEENLREVI